MQESIMKEEGQVKNTYMLDQCIFSKTVNFYVRISIYSKSPLIQILPVWK